MAADPEIDLLTVAEAARLLKVSRVTLHRWVKQGRLPACHVGPRAVRIRRGDLDKMVTPVRREEVQPMNEAMPLVTPITVRPPTEEEVRRGLAALEAAEALGERILARRGGQPLEESWPMIREAREERSKQL